MEKDFFIGFTDYEQNYIFIEKSITNTTLELLINKEDKVSLSSSSLYILSIRNSKTNKLKGKQIFFGRIQQDFDGISSIFSLCPIQECSFQMQDILTGILIQDYNALFVSFLKLLNQSIDFEQFFDSENRRKIYSKLCEKIKHKITNLEISLDLDNLASSKQAKDSLSLFILNNCSQTKIKYWNFRDVFVKQNPSNYRDIFIDQNWNSHREILWQFLNLEEKQRLIKAKYSWFKSCWDDINTYTYKFSVKKSAREFYEQNPLSDQDKILIEYWTNSRKTSERGSNESHKDIHEKMESARNAEKFIISFLTELGFNPKDISIEQINDASDRKWETYDIECQNQDQLIYIDVKNARQYKREQFPELCVKKLKYYNKSDVLIAGIISPNHNNTRHNKITSITCLGFFSKATLESLTRFLDKILLDAPFKVEIQSDINKYRDSKFYPSWLFDYGEIFYQNQINAIQTFKKFIDQNQDEMLTLDDIKVLGIDNVIPLYISSSRKLPQNLSDALNLEPWEIEMINFLISEKFPRRSSGLISLPYLYVFLWSHFLGMLFKEKQSKLGNFSPKKYLRILFAEPENIPFEFEEDNNLLPFLDDQIFPLSIYDPLGIIRRLIRIFDDIYSNEQLRSHLMEFESFKMTANNILKGKKYKGGKEEYTLLAYCGRFKKREDKPIVCKTSPLYIGNPKYGEHLGEYQNMNEYGTCSKCLWLKCHECGFCKCNYG